MRLLPFIVPFSTVTILLVSCYVGLTATQELVPHIWTGDGLTPPSVPYTYAPDDPQAKTAANNEEEADEEEDNTSVDAEVAKNRQSIQQHFENQRNKRQVPYSRFPPPPTSDWIPTPVQDEVPQWRQPFDIPPPPLEVPTGESYARRRLSRKKSSGQGNPWGGLGSTSGLGLDNEYDLDKTDDDLDLDRNDDGDDNDRDDFDDGSKRRKREAGWNAGPPMPNNRSMSMVQQPYPGGGPPQRPYEQPGNSRYQPVQHEGPGSYSRQNQTSMHDRPRGAYGLDRASDRGPEYRGAPHRPESGHKEHTRPMHRESARYDGRRTESTEREPYKEYGRKEDDDADRSSYRKSQRRKHGSRKEDDVDDRDEDKYDRDEHGGRGGPKEGAGSREYHRGGKNDNERPHSGNEHGNCKDKKKELERCVLKLLLAHPHELYDNWYKKSTLSGRDLLKRLREKTDATKDDYRTDTSASQLSDLVWNVCEVIEEKRDDKHGGKRDGKGDRKGDDSRDEKDDESRDHKSSSGWDDSANALG